MKRDLALVGIVALAAAFAGGCFLFRSPEAPMPTEVYAAEPAPGVNVGPEGARGLVVFLPGLADGPADFEAHGFVARARAMGFDVVAADAHLGYYTQGFTVVERLGADVIEPARASGYDVIWLVGISMGGYGALSGAMAYADAVTGVIVLAPYLGGSDVQADVAQAGGLATWDAPDPTWVVDPEDRHDVRLWRFLRGYVAAPERRPALWIGWGRDDDVAPMARIIANALPTGRAATREGGHAWVVWEPLFETLTEAAWGR